MEIGFKLKTTYSDTMINYHLSQKFKLLRNCEFNHLTIFLTITIDDFPNTTWKGFRKNSILFCHRDQPSFFFNSFILATIFIQLISLELWQKQASKIFGKPRHWRPPTCKMAKQRFLEILTTFYIQVLY